MTEALAAAPSAVQIDPNAGQIPNPAESSIPQKEAPDEIGQPPSGKERKSIEQIIKDSHAKVTKEAAEKEAKPEKPEAKAEPKTEGKPEAKPEAKEPAKEAKTNHGPDGKFVSTKETEAKPEPAKEAPKADTPHREPPSRFSADAKAEWETAPESVKAETHRAVRELEAGLNQYRESAKAYDEIKDFDQLAKRAGTTVRKALDQYISLDMNLRSQDPNVQQKTIEHIFQHAGVDPHEWAARLLDQPVDERQSEERRTIEALRSELAQVRQEVGGVTQSMRQQAVNSLVSSFAESRPRYAELETTIASILRGDEGYSIAPDLQPHERLQKAYELAERLNPPAAKPEPLTPAPEPDKGNKSIGGAPASGSDPVVPARKQNRPPSIEEAMKRAKARLAS